MSKIIVEDIQKTSESTALTWPSADGSANQFMQTDGSGTLSFASPGSDYFHVYQSSAQSIANATLTLLDFGTETFDTGSNFNLSTDKYIVPSAGKYWIAASVGINGQGDGKEIITRIKNDSTIIMEMRLSAGVANNDPIAFISGIFELAVNDEITFSVQHDNGSSKNTRAGAENTYFCGYKIGAS